MYVLLEVLKKMCTLLEYYNYIIKFIELNHALKYIYKSSIIIIVSTYKRRNVSKTNLKVSHRLVFGPYKVQKEVKSTQNSHAVKKWCSLKILGEKSCEIKGGGQEMAAMILILKKFNNGCVCIVKTYRSINIIAAIS